MCNFRATTLQKNQGADDEVVSTLESMLGDRFNCPNDVSEAIGKLN